MNRPFHIRRLQVLADGAAEIGAAIGYWQHDHLDTDADPGIEAGDAFAPSGICSLCDGQHIR
jgi:hypothetical protein